MTNYYFAKSYHTHPSQAPHTHTSTSPPSPSHTYKSPTLDKLHSYTHHLPWTNFTHTHTSPTLDKLEDLLVLLLGLGLLDEVDLVLQDEDVAQLHDLDGGQMF